MPLYCQWKDPEDKGRPAVNKIYEDTKTKIAGGATVSLDDLAPLHMYQWQLSNEEVQDIKVWTDKCLESLQIVSTLPTTQICDQLDYNYQEIEKGVAACRGPD